MKETLVECGWKEEESRKEGENEGKKWREGGRIRRRGREGGREGGRKEEMREVYLSHFIIIVFSSSTRLQLIKCSPSIWMVSCTVSSPPLWIKFSDVLVLYINFIHGSTASFIQAAFV